MRIIYHVICEGKSELAYVQILNRIFRELRPEISFLAHEANGGNPHNIRNTFLQIKMHEKKAGKIIAILDEDIYIRNSTFKGKLPPEVACKFNHMNFEDFLVLHCPADKLNKWIEDCELSGHLNEPLHGDEVEIRMRRLIFPHYRHGHMPSGFRIDEAAIRKMIARSNDPLIPFFSDLAVFLDKLLKDYWRGGNGCKN